MSVKRGLAQLSRALRLGRRGRESEARTPDHSCPVAQSWVTVSIPKQATDSKKDLAYSLWLLLSIEPQGSKGVPCCTVLKIKIAKSCRSTYNGPSTPVRL